MESLFRRD